MDTDSRTEQRSRVVYVGADPGQSAGGIAAIEGDELHLWKMPGDVSGIVSVLREAAALGDRVVLAVEKVHAMPGQGVSSTFGFGRNRGHLEAAAEALGFEWALVPPKVWQRDTGLKRAFAAQYHPDGRVTADQEKRARKNFYRDEARRRFGRTDIYLWGADAAWIAAWAGSKGSLS